MKALPLDSVGKNFDLWLWIKSPEEVDEIQAENKFSN